MNQHYQITAIALSYLIAGAALMAEPADGANKKETAPAAASSQAGTGKQKADSAKAILGTWINEDYNGQGRSGRVVYTKGPGETILYVATDMADGSGEKYPGTVVFHEQSTDSKGCLCGVSTVTLKQGFKWKTLSRISADGKTLEVQSDVEKIDPKGPRYSIYHRQE